MNLKLILCVTLALSSGCFGRFSIASADEVVTNAAAANSPQNNVLATLKSNWTETKVALYRTSGAIVQLDAKKRIYTNTNNRIEFVIVALMDPQSDKSWIGVADVDANSDTDDFYVETASGVVAFTKVFFGKSILLRDTLISKAENLDDLIWQFDKQDYGKYFVESTLYSKLTTQINFSQYFNKFFSPARPQTPSNMAFMPVENIRVHGGTMRLDFTSDGTPGSVWIDLKTRKAIKVMENRVLILTLFWIGFAAVICWLIFILRRKFKP